MEWLLGFIEKDRKPDGKIMDPRQSRSGMTDIIVNGADTAKQILQSVTSGKNISTAGRPYLGFTNFKAAEFKQ
jgi:hypothetical protein